MILVILLVGLMARLIAINQSLWLDESINVLAAKHLTFWHFVTGYPIGDFHPPLYFGILWIWTRLFGFSEVAVRAPSIIFGLGAILLTFLIGRELWNKKIGHLAAFLLAINPLHVYYSQEARMYSLAAFVVTLNAWFFIRILNKKGRYALLGYVISLVLVLYSDYLPYLIIPTQLLFLICWKREFLLKIVGGMLMAGIFLIPWLLIFPTQLISGRQTAIAVPGWERVVGKADLRNFLLVYIKTVTGRIGLANNKILYLPVALFGILYGLVIGINVRKMDWQTKLVLAWAFIPAILALLVSFFIPVLSYFRMIFIIPGFVLSLALGVSLMPKILIKPITVLLILISLACLSWYYVNPSYQREDWKGLVSFLTRNSDDRTLTLFEDSNLPAPFQYYANSSVQAMGGLQKFPAETTKDTKDLADLTIAKKRVFLVDYLVEIADPNRVIERRLFDLGYTKSHEIDFPALGLVYEFTK